MTRALTDLAMRLERTVRADASERVVKAVEPVLQRFGDTLRAALHPVVGHGADLIVVAAIQRMREDVIAGASTIAESQAIDAAVRRLPTEEQAFALTAETAA